jgi:hypothetical protein
MSSSRSQLLGLFVSASFGMVACQGGGTMGSPGGTVGPSGGMVATPDGVTLEVPPGALSSEVAITVAIGDEAPAGALGSAYHFQPDGLTFSQPARITLPYTPNPGLPSDAIQPVFVLDLSAGAGSTSPVLGTPTGPEKVQAQTPGLSTFVPVQQIAGTLGGQLDYPKGIAVNASHVYFSSGSLSSQPGAGGVVMRAPIAGGAPEIFASGQPDPKHLALDDTYVYWTDGGSGPTAGDAGIMKAPLAGGPPVRIARAGFPIDIAVNRQYVFWTDYDLHTINRAALDGSGPVALSSTGDQPMVLSIDAANVYWLSGGTHGGHDGAIMQAPIEGGPAVTLAQDQAEPASLAVDGQSVYWVNAGDGLVQRVPIGGGTNEVLRHMTRPNAIAVDDTSYYVGEVLPGMIVSYPKAGGTGDVRSATESHPNQIVLDSKNIYWVNDGASDHQGDALLTTKSP